MGDLDDLLDEQVRYYEARAPEYDDWWTRVGRYERDAAYHQQWLTEVAMLRTYLELAAPLGSVLELAAGTGNWTRELARLGSDVIAVDTSPASLAIARAKVAELDEPAPVEFHLADAFQYEAPRPMNTVFLGFWLTHVPDARFELFWNRVRSNLGPDGRVIFFDNAHPDISTTVPGSPLVRDAERVTGTDGHTDLGAGVATRHLADGREFRIVKRFWHTDELSDRLSDLGWEAEVSTTPYFYLLGSARLRLGA